MKEIRTPRALVSAYKKHSFGQGDDPIPSAKVLADDYGVRIRRTKDSKTFGDNVWDLATTYFYTSQQTTTSQVKRLRAFAAEHGFIVTTLDFWSGTVIEVLAKDHLCYAFRAWPQTSWASIMVRIEKAPDLVECEGCGRLAREMDTCDASGKVICENCCESCDKFESCLVELEDEEDD